MAKYHVSSDGNPRVCKALEGNCPIGGNESHYTSKEAARAAFEASVEVLTSIPKKTLSEKSTRTVNQDGDVQWRNSNGELHRDNDLPAFEGLDGSKSWYQNGKRHRDGGQPAIEWADGVKGWYQNGLAHRDNDLPAIEEVDGTKYWYQNGLIHRDGDLPAIERADGTKNWCQNGLLHRDGGLPAIELPDGAKWWYQNGKFQYRVLPDGTRRDRL